MPGRNNLVIYSFQLDDYLTSNGGKGGGERVLALLPGIGPFIDLEVRARDLKLIIDKRGLLNHRSVMTIFQIAMGEGPKKLAMLDSMTISYLYKHPSSSMSRVSDLNVSVLCAYMRSYF